jgi:hypothetical protein
VTDDDLVAPAGINVDDPTLGLLLTEASAAAHGDAALEVPALAAGLLAPGEQFTADFVLAGGAVVRGGFAADLAAFAERTGLGVLNTFTAKGLFRWDSPFHLGTGCLQQDDLRLAGAGPQSSVFVVGVDVDECRPALLAAAGLDPGLSRWRAVHPADLGAAAGQVRASWGGPPQPPPQPELFTVLWNVAQPLYALDQAPLNPARAAADVATALGGDGVVCAEPGQAGWWIGRTVPTTRLGSVAIPAAGRPGAAVARAILLARQGVPALAVVDAPLSAPAAALVQLAREMGLSLVVEVWGESGQRMSAHEHRAMAESALAATGAGVYQVAIDYAPTERLIEAAGPLVAWT